MRSRLSSLLCMVIVLLIALPSVAEESSDDERPRVKLPAYWAGMANKVQLDHDQRVKLKTAIDTRTTALAQLEPKIDQARADRSAAKDADDKAAADEARQKLNDLRAQEDKVEADFLIAARDLLEDEQVVEWEYARLLFSMNMTFKKYDLTDSQRQAMDKVTREAGEKLAALEPDDVKGSNQVVTQTKNQFYLNHLTEAQQQAHPRKVKQDEVD